MNFSDELLNNPEDRELTSRLTVSELTTALTAELTSQLTNNSSEEVFVDNSEPLYDISAGSPLYIFFILLYLAIVVLGNILIINYI